MVMGRLSALALAIAVAGCSTNAQPLTKAEEVDATVVEVSTATQADIEPQYAATANLSAEREAQIVAEVGGEVVQVLVEEGDHVVAGQILARVDGERARLELAKSQSIADRMSHEAERNAQLVDRHLIARETADRTRYDRDTQNAAVGLAKLKLDRTAIRAPYAGTVTRRHIKAGQWLDPQVTAFEIADFSNLKARIAVPEKDSTRLHAGQTVSFTADGIGERQFSGVVERISPVVDRASGTVSATIAVDNRDGSLRPGLFARMSISYDHINQALMVPKQALASEDGQSRLFVVEKGHVHRRTVALGVEHQDKVEIRAGIDPGAVVVTSGNPALRDGDAVAIADSAPVAQPKTTP